MTTKTKEPQVIEGEVVKTTEKPKAEKKSKPKKSAKPGTAVATATRTAPAKIEPKDEPTLMVAIARAAADPAVNVDKMVALHNLHREIQGDAARREFDMAFSEMQTELPIITKGRKIEIYAKNDPEHLNPPIQSTPFAGWDDIGRVIKPILSRHGFAIWFKNSREGADVITTAILTHRGGHREETTVRVPLDTSGSKNNAQGVGSSTQYGKRYSGSSILNIIFEDEDDDAQSTAPTAEERRVARTQRTDGRLGNLADKTAPKDEEHPHDEDGVIHEDPKPEAKPAGGTNKKKAAPAAKDDAQPAGDAAANPDGPKSPHPNAVSYEEFRKYIEETLPKCQNPGHLEMLWRRDVLGHGPLRDNFAPPDRADLENIFKARKEALAGGGKK